MQEDRWTGRCHKCGKAIPEPPPSRIAEGRGKFCSRRCGAIARATRHGHNTRDHASTRTYRTWNHMKQRCENPNNDNFAHYGGRGISVCERWRSFENFLADMGERPAGTSLDRIDVNGNYEPGNCRWATQKVQRSNERRTFHVTYRGEEMCLYHAVLHLGHVSFAGGPKISGRDQRGSAQTMSAGNTRGRSRSPSLTCTAASLSTRRCQTFP